MYKKTKLSKYLNIIANVVVLISSYLYIIWQFNGKRNNVNFQNFDFLNISLSNFILLGLVISILTFINWSMEALKWKLLIKPIQKISFKKSFKSILIGLFTSLFMPNRSGEWIGRIFSIPNVNKGALFVHTIIGNVIQYSITLFFGVISMFYFLDMNVHILNNFDFNYNYLTFITIGLLLILGVFLLFIFNVFKGLWVNKLKIKIQNSIKYLKTVSFNVIIKLLSLSFLRYITFTLQYIILFYAFDISINTFDLLMLLSLYYFVLSIVPTFVISEIGVRGSLSIIIFSSYCEFYSHSIPNLIPLVVFISLLVWLFNIIIPSIVGSFFIAKFKLFGKWSF